MTTSWSSPVRFDARYSCSSSECACSFHKAYCSSRTPRCIQILRFTLTCAAHQGSRRAFSTGLSPSVSSGDLDAMPHPDNPIPQAYTSWAPGFQKVRSVAQTRELKARPPLSAAILMLRTVALWSFRKDIIAAMVILVPFMLVGRCRSSPLTVSHG